MWPSVAQSPPLELTLSDSDTVGPPPSADGAELGPLDQEAELAAVGREEGRPGPRGAGHRRGGELIVLPKPELHSALGGADVDHALAVGRDGDPVARDVRRRQRLGRAGDRG